MRIKPLISGRSPGKASGEAAVGVHHYVVEECEGGGRRMAEGGANAQILEQMKYSGGGEQKGNWRGKKGTHQ